VRWKSTDVSEKHVASVFKVEEQNKQERASLLFDPETGDSTFLLNVSGRLPDYTALHLVRQQISVLFASSPDTIKYWVRLIWVPKVWDQLCEGAQPGSKLLFRIR
jgi:hypothetical protein